MYFALTRVTDKMTLVRFRVQENSPCLQRWDSFSLCNES